MEKPITRQLLELPYENRKNTYLSTFSLGTFQKAKSVNDKMVLLSLICYAYFQMKVKKPEITHLEVVLAVTKAKKDSTAYYQMLESLAIVCEDLCYNTTSADSCGLDTSKKVIDKIKEILTSWVPF